MTFWEKLDKLTLGQRSEISEKAGLPPSAISNYITKKQMPGADKAAAIARALSVPLEWMLDDQRDFPAPKPPPASIENIDDGTLMREACRRQRLEAIRIRDLLERAKKVNWIEVAEFLLKCPDDFDCKTGPFSEQIELAYSILLSEGTLRRYDASHGIIAWWRELPQADQPREDFDPDRLEKSQRSLNESTGCGPVQLYLFTGLGRARRGNSEEIEAAKQRLRDSIATISAKSPAAPKKKSK